MTFLSLHLHLLEAGKDSCQWTWCECDQPGRLLPTACCSSAWAGGARSPPVETWCQRRGQKCEPSCPAPPGLPEGPLPGTESFSWAEGMGACSWWELSVLGMLQRGKFGGGPRAQTHVLLPSPKILRCPGQDCLARECRILVVLGWAFPLPLPAHPHPALHC